MGRTGMASLDSHGQPQWQLRKETFLLPLPHLVSPDKADTVGALSSPMINSSAEDSELRLAVWTAEATHADEHLYGQILLEGSDLFRGCYNVNDKRKKRAARFCLSSSNSGKSATKIFNGITAPKMTGEVAALEALLFLLGPENVIGITDNQSMPLLTAPRNVDHASLSLDSQLGQILANIECSTSEEPCHKEISRLTDILTSNPNPEVTNLFLTRGGAIFLGKRLAELSTPLDRKNSIKILCGLLSKFLVLEI